jgi:predicted RecB family nuclease
MISDEVIENYLNCKYKAYRKLNNEHGIKKEYELFQKEQLSELKTKFYDSLLEEHGEDKLLHGFKFGSNSRLSKVNVLIQPTLEIEAFQISFDAMEIDSNKNSSSRKMNIPIMISSNENIQKAEKLAICIKCVILSQLFGIDYEFGKIVYGSNLRILKFKIKPLLMEAKRMLNELIQISKGESKLILFQKSHCKICEFQETCKKELIEQDGLGLLSRMDEKEIKRYNNKGIFTVKQLSFTFRPRKRNKRVKINKHPYYFPLQALAIREQKTYLYDKVNMPNTKTKVFIDMEGYLGGRYIYLIGLLVVENGKEIRYSLWANNASEEKKYLGNV